MINRLGTSILTALVLYCLLFDVSNIYSSITKSTQYEPASTNGGGIGMITSAQPQSALTEKSIANQRDLNAISMVKVCVASFMERFRNMLLGIKLSFANFFRRKSRPNADLLLGTPVTLKKIRSPNSISSYPISYGGSLTTEKEKEGLDFLDTERRSIKIHGDISPWLHSATITDLLRFLRARNGNVEEAFKNIMTHAKWRTSKYGADTILRENAFQNSEMNKEVFWLGISTTDCPTLVIRTQAHDGVDYNEDPKIFTRLGT